MGFDVLTDGLKNWLDTLWHVDWLSTTLTVLVVIVVTGVISRTTTSLIKKLLRVDKNPLPALTIFVNVARGTIWAVGICVILGSCFNINLTAAVTALGIGGIAVSLGFQDTLKNLVAGLQVSLTKLVVPGDHIRLGTSEGIVKDVTWRHTRILTAGGEHIIIPNSLMNTNALERLQPRSLIRIPIIIPMSSESTSSLSDALMHMENAVNEAVSATVPMQESAKITLTEAIDHGYKGTLSFVIIDGANVAEVKTAALKALSNFINT